MSDHMKSMKNNTWKEILTAVNATCCAENPRTVSEIQKKYSDLKSAVKKKLSSIEKERGATGGGPSTAEELTALEVRITV